MIQALDVLGFGLVQFLQLQIIPGYSLMVFFHCALFVCATIIVVSLIRR